MNSLAVGKKFLFSDAVHPEYQCRPAHGWFPNCQKTAIRTISGRQRINIQGALDLVSSMFTFAKGEKNNAKTTPKMLKKIEKEYPDTPKIHIILDNARYHQLRSFSHD